MNFTQHLNQISRSMYGRAFLNLPDDDKCVCIGRWYRMVNLKRFMDALMYRGYYWDGSPEDNPVSVIARSSADQDFLNKNHGAFDAGMTTLAFELSEFLGIYGRDADDCYTAARSRFANAYEARYDYIARSVMNSIEPPKEPRPRLPTTEWLEELDS